MAMPTEKEIFGGPAPAAGGAPEIGDAELDSMFGEDMGEGLDDPQTKLMDSLIGAGFSPTPDQISQIMEILQGGGMSPDGLEPTDSGMETPPAM